MGTVIHAHYSSNKPMRELRLEHTLERASGGQDAESHVQFEMQRIWREAEDTTETNSASTDEIIEKLDEVNGDDQIVAALKGLVRWERNRDYDDGAIAALDAFDGVVENALSNEWVNVAAYSNLLAANIAADLSNDEATSELIPQLIDLFDNHWEDLTPNNRSNVLDGARRLQHYASDETLDELDSVLKSVAEAAHNESEYDFERKLLETRIDLQREQGEGISSIQDLIIASYDAEAEGFRGQGPTQRAGIFQRALSHCAEFADEEQMNEWKQQLRSANRDWIENMPRIEHQPSDEEIEEIEEGLQAVIDHAEEISRNQNGIFSLMFLLSHDEFLPILDDPNPHEDGVSIMDLVSHRTLTTEGDSIPQPEDRTRPSTYNVMVQFRDNLLSRVLSSVFERNIVSEVDLYIYLWSVDGLTVDDIAYLTDFIIATFDDRYADSLHLGVVRLEGVIASMLKAAGFETAGLQDGYTTPKPLSSLLNSLDGRVNGRLIEYIRYRYSDISGQGIRNKVAHGRAEYRQASPQMSLYLLYDIFCTIAWIDKEL